MSGHHRTTREAEEFEYIDEEELADNLAELAPQIGWVVIFFNSLEDTVASCVRDLMLHDPDQNIATLGSARQWALEFVHWYNHDHRHSGIRYVSPAQRHDGADLTILAARHEVYQRARERNPARWSGHNRDGSPIASITLNPERESVVTAASRAKHHQPLAA